MFVIPCQNQPATALVSHLSSAELGEIYYLGAPTAKDYRNKDKKDGVKADQNIIELHFPSPLEIILVIATHMLDSAFEEMTTNLPAKPCRRNYHFLVLAVARGPGRTDVIYFPTFGVFQYVYFASRLMVVNKTIWNHTRKSVGDRKASRACDPQREESQLLSRAGALYVLNAEEMPSPFLQDD
ncbi:MAG: hypothetical protein Q9159_001044 [Coniocarpon cinnabarinum]